MPLRRPTLAFVVALLVCVVPVSAAPLHHGEAPAHAGRPPTLHVLTARAVGARVGVLGPARRARLAKQGKRAHRYVPVKREKRNAARAGANGPGAPAVAESPAPPLVEQSAVPQGTFSVIRRTDLRGVLAPGFISVVNEPCVAQGGSNVFMTGNWYAASSSNSGRTFAALDPFTLFPSVDNGFCCDQSVVYDPVHDLFLWLLAYVPDAEGNTVRLAVAHGAQGIDTADKWSFYDLTPQKTISEPSGRWFDFPQISLGGNSIYVTANVFRTSNDIWTKSVIMRLSAADVAAGSPSPAIDYFTSTDHFNFTTVAGAGSTMYWLSHDRKDFKTRVYRWAEGGGPGTVASDDVAVNPYGVQTASCPGPDGRDWCERSDDRVLGAWVSKGVIGFMWDSAKDATHPFPYVRVVRVTETSPPTVIDQPDLTSSTFAWAYPSVAVNARGDIAGTVFFGGGPKYPSVAAFVLDDLTSAPPPWAVFTLLPGQSGPALDSQGNYKWGDFLCARPASPQANTWVASGYRLLGGATGNDVHPEFLWLGRERDVPPCGEEDVPCTDGNPCTVNDTCHAGTCMIAESFMCPAPDDCHDAGVCDPTTGGCVNAPKPDGTACATGNACARTSVCQSGLCSAAAVVACQPADACHDAGVCNPDTGACSNPALTATTVSRLLGDVFAGAECGAPADRRFVTRVTKRLESAQRKLELATEVVRTRRMKRLLKASAELVKAAARLANHPGPKVSDPCAEALTGFVGARRERLGCLL